MTSKINEVAKFFFSHLQQRDVPMLTKLSE